jgi:hypothetical protein
MGMPEGGDYLAEISCWAPDSQAQEKWIDTREIGGIYDEGIQGPDHRSQSSRYLHSRGWSDTDSNPTLPAGANRATRTCSAGGRNASSERFGLD